MVKFGFFLICILSLRASGQQLTLRSDNTGINYLSYRNTILVNRPAKNGSALTAEAYKTVDRSGKISAGWPHLQKIERLDANTSKYRYNVCDLLYRVKQVKDSVFLEISITNNSKTDTLAGINLIPLQLVFPQRPKNFQRYFPYYHYNLDGPSVIAADYGSGKMVLSNEDTHNPLFVGLLDANSKSGKIVYKIWVSAIPFNGMQTRNIPAFDAGIAPGKSVTYRLGIRFYPPGTSDAKVAPSVLASYRARQTVKFEWKDRRPIGSLFLSSETKQNKKDNPRGWLPGQKINTNTAAGRNELCKKVLAYARNSISILKNMNAQGMITWDIEGQEFPHAISYIGSPDKMKQTAPEMIDIADEYFALFRNAGLRTGICIRPQEFTLSKDRKKASQETVKDPAEVLIRKIRYARDRWGCTIFYIDSNIDGAGILMNADVFRKVMEAVPGVLLIPEHENTKYFEYAAPYEEMRLGTRTKSDLVAATYPSSFLVINTAEGMYNAKGVRVVSDDVLRQSLRQGNIFLFRAWYEDQPANGIIKKLTAELYNKPGNKK